MAEENGFTSPEGNMAKKKLTCELIQSCSSIEQTIESI